MRMVNAGTERRMPASRSHLQRPPRVLMSLHVFYAHLQPGSLRVKIGDAMT